MGRPGPKTFEERGIQRWVVDSETGCWIWTGRKLQGYGLMSNGRAHRIMYEQHLGPIPEAHDLHHLCRNPACVNPEHLEPKRRSEHLSYHHSSFSIEQAREIRALGSTFMPLTEIAARTGVDEQGVWKVLEAIRYPELGPPILYQRTCPECGIKIVGKSRRTKFCCSRHQERYNGRRLARERREANRGQHGS